MLGFKAFIQQTDGFIVICDGAQEARFSSVAKFRAIAPDYALPAGCIGVNYEERADRTFYLFFQGNAPVQGAAVDPEGMTKALLQKYISKVADYMSRQS